MATPADLKLPLHLQPIARGPRWVGVLVTLCAALLALFSLPGCDEAPSDPNKIALAINGHRFVLDLALEDAVRYKGLGQRESIPSDGGMMFVFPKDRVTVQEFLMRDCLVDIDIVYLDGSGRVLSWYAMKKEPPRGPDEGSVGDYSNKKYHDRLPRYSSKFPSQFVLEFQGGTLAKLDLKEGMKIEFDTEGLKKRVK